MDDGRMIELPPIGEQLRQLLVGRTGRFGRGCHKGELRKEREAESK
jgi:hypothetical protein